MFYALLFLFLLKLFLGKGLRFFAIAELMEPWSVYNN